MLQRPNFGYMINCRSRISLKLQQNEIDLAARGKFILVNLRQSYVGQFGRSSFLSCAGLV